MNEPKKFEIKRYSDHEAMHRDQLRYWQSRPASERLQAISDISLVAYQLKNGGRDVPRLQRTLRRIERTEG